MPSRRRRIIWLVGAALLSFAAWHVIQWRLDARYAVPLDEVAKIANGMSLAEVESLLGRRGDHRNRIERTLREGETLELEGAHFEGPRQVRATVVDWTPRRGPYVRVAFDEQEKVFSKKVVHSPGDAGLGFWRTARRWMLGR